MVIIVDLDGTLIRKDSSFSNFLRIMLCNPVRGMIAAWKYCFYGEAVAKRYTAYQAGDSRLRRNMPWLEAFAFRASPGMYLRHSASFNFNAHLVNYLLKAKQDGATLVLATGANIKTARIFAHQLNLFDDIIASDEYINCIGVKKLNAIEAKYKDFMYIGDHWYDMPIWQAARVIGVVRPNTILLGHLKKQNKELVVFE